MASIRRGDVARAVGKKPVATPHKSGEPPLNKVEMAMRKCQGYSLCPEGKPCRSCDKWHGSSLLRPFSAAEAGVNARVRGSDCTDKARTPNRYGKHLRKYGKRVVHKSERQIARAKWNRFRRLSSGIRKVIEREVGADNYAGSSSLAQLDRIEEKVLKDLFTGFANEVKL